MSSENLAIGEEQEREASELHDLAESIVRECKQDREDSLASLHTAIFLLRDALNQQSPSDPMRSDTALYLSTALLTRFHQSGWIEDFEKAIELAIDTSMKAMQAVNQKPDITSKSNATGQDQHETIQLARDMLTDFHKSVGCSSIDTAVRLYRDALILRLAANPKRISTLTALAGSLVIRFQVMNQLEDLAEAIILSREALHSLPPPDPARYQFIIYHCASQCTKFGWTREIQDLRDAALLYSAAEREDEEARESFSSGTDMMEVFERSGNVADLEGAVSLLYASLWLRPAPHPRRSVSLNSLATALWTRFERRGQLADLEESIGLYREALDLRPAPHPFRNASLNNLANSLLARFEQKGKLTDLEESIGFYKEALDLLPAYHPDRSTALSNLGSAFTRRFEQKGQLADLEESITFHRESLDLLPALHPDRSRPLSNIGTALIKRFERKGQLADLEECIAFQREALDVLPPSHPVRSMSLINLANALARRFEQKGQFADLEECIAFHREAMDLLPASSPSRSMLLNNISAALSMRFQQKGQLTDLEESITVYREALDLRPAPHPERAMSLKNLATALSTRFERKGQLADLEESISFHREALDLIPTSHDLRPASLNNLAAALSNRFKQKGQLADLEERIAFTREALHLTPALHPNRSMSLNNLANALSTRFKHKGQLADLDESIAFYRDAVDLYPAPHPLRSTGLSNLADALSARFERKGQLADLEESISAFRDGATCITSSVIQRFHSARVWAIRSDAFHHSSTLEAYQQATDLLPRLASLDMTIKERHEALSRARGLACDACAFAIRIGQLEKAVEFISAGRTVFWSQALQLRTPMDDLESDEPVLAEKLRGIANALEQASLRDLSQTFGRNSEVVKDLEKQASHYRQLSEEWNHILVEVRRREKYKHFLLPQPFRELRRAACNGPVVILNSSLSGSDGLLITQDGVHHVSLAISLETIAHLVITLRAALSSNLSRSGYTDTIHENLHQLNEQMRNDGRHASRVPVPGRSSDDLFRLVLTALWQCVALPVVRALRLQKSDSLKRIWWCPTGMFTLLPIHAAGIYDGEESECLSNYAISSYIPTLEALLVPPPPTVHPFRMLIVIQPEMQGRPELGLPYTTKELEKIQQHVSNQHLITFGTREAPTSVVQVLSQLSSVSLAHFACHGTQDLVNPLESALLLDDGDLKVSKIMEQRIPNASLAFLSACETAKGDERIADESVHLSAAMLFAGFCGVVGTLWSILDQDAPEVADVFYGHLFKNGRTSDPHIDITDAALALHLAVRKLRVEQNAGFRRWVPFIHLGV